MDKDVSRKRPQVLLLGNGLNIGCGGKSWDELMKMICCNPNITGDVKLNSPMPLQAIIVTNDHVDEALKKNKGEFYGCVTDKGQRQRLNSLLEIGFDHILTTNYSYELECAAYEKEIVTDYILGKHRRITSGDEVTRAESKYMLHTYYEAERNGAANKIWHIHGEARKPDSMILGHYYYGLLLQRYIQLLEKRGNGYVKYQQSDKEIPIHSWLDAFILGDIYVLGFGYHLSEFDLWWLLNRKKRERAEVGTVHFYEMKSSQNGILDERLELLKLMGVEIHDMGMIKDRANYNSFYQSAIEDISRRVAAGRKNSL